MVLLCKYKHPKSFLHLNGHVGKGEKRTEKLFSYASLISGISTEIHYAVCFCRPHLLCSVFSHSFLFQWLHEGGFFCEFYLSSSSSFSHFSAEKRKLCQGSETKRKLFRNHENLHVTCIHIWENGVSAWLCMLKSIICNFTE